MSDTTNAATLTVNGQDELLCVQTLAGLLADRGVSPDGRGVAVALNGTVVRRAEWATTALHAGDVVEIVRAMRGG